MFSLIMFAIKLKYFLLVLFLKESLLLKTIFQILITHKDIWQYPDYVNAIHAPFALCTRQSSIPGPGPGPGPQSSVILLARVMMTADSCLFVWIVIKKAAKRFCNAFL